MTEFTLPPHIDVNAAEELKQAAMSVEDEGLTLAADQVATVSSAGLQMLIAANRHLLANGKTLTLQEPSASIAAAFEGLGFEEEFNKLKVEQ